LLQKGKLKTQAICFYKGIEREREKQPLPGSKIGLNKGKSGI
jgi:hypothetical protein